MLWTEHSNDESYIPRYGRTVPAANAKPELLRALLVEYGAHNIVAQRIDNELILVLISGKIPGRNGRNLHVEIEKSGHESNEATVDDSSKLITIQRQKAQTLARYIAKQTKSLNAAADVEH